MRLFVDMDGTLAVFTPVDTLETLYEKGYFAKLEPHTEVLEGLKLFIKENPEIEVNILSSVLDDSKYALEEKQEWLDRYLPEIDRRHRFFPACGEEKTSAISDGVKSTDFLLDDYTKNLQEWEPPAIGIKLMNGINGTKGTWTGCKVNYDLPPRSFSLALYANIVFAISKLNLEGNIEMNLRKIQNGDQIFTVLDEINQAGEKQRLLLIRDTDSSVIIAHGWNEKTGQWDHGTYYNSELSSLSAAISDFEEYRMKQTILNNDKVLHSKKEVTNEMFKEEDLEKPVAVIAPGVNRLNFIVELDKQSQQNIETAIRIVEMREGYFGSELEAVVSEAMTNRLCDLEEDITLITGNVLDVNDKAVKGYLKLQTEKETAAYYVSALKKSMMQFDENSMDYQALIDELDSFAAPNLSDIEKRLTEMRKQYPSLETLYKLSNEQFAELNYEEQFKALLSVEFPDIAGDETLQEKVYQSFLDSPYSSFFGDDLYDYLDHQIGKFQEESLNHAKENGKSIYLVKDDGKEIE